MRLDRCHRPGSDAGFTPAAGLYALFVETLTFLFTDIEGSTRLLQRLGEEHYAQLLADHHALIRSALVAHGGDELNTLGDGFFAGFSSPRACVAAVLEMQEALEAHAWPDGELVRVRMGVHTGEAAQTAAGPVGLDVHRAARIAAVAHGGQILLSETAAALVRDSMPAEVTLEDLGMHRLKDLGRPERILQLHAPGLQADFPALQSLGNPALQNNLPVQLAPFIGRSRELGEVRALVESSRLVTLTGAGGSGKTRLGLQVAAELLDGTGDGVWLVELAPISDEDAVAPSICDALEIPGQRGRPVLETLLEALAPQRILIILDNCEHLIGACAKTADTILRRCPLVYLLATSREPLGITGETIYRVPSMSLPGRDEVDPGTAESSDAVALFVDRARAQGVDVPLNEQTGPLVVSICRQLDGMPLAIELAAARLRSLSLGELRARLDQRFRLLTGGSRTAMERQQTLRATVDWSYALLTGAEQLLLRRLSVFPETFQLEAAEAICGFGDIAAFEVTVLLGSLVDKSLVVAEQAGGDLRYRLLETIRQFAAERLLSAGDDEASVIAARHCEHFLSVAEAAAVHLTGPEQATWIAQLSADQANLRRATQHALGDPQRTETVLRFGVALRRYWMWRSEDTDATNLLVQALDRPDARADIALFCAAAITAVLSARVIDVELAHRLGDLALGIARQLDDDRLLIEALASLSGNYYFAGEPENGVPLGEEAVERARRLGDDVLLGSSLLGYLLSNDSIDPAGFDELFAEAIACTQRSGDMLIASLLYNNAAVHALRAGDAAAARAHLNNASSMTISVSENTHHVAVNLGWVERLDNAADAARSMFEDGLRMSRRYGDRLGLAYSILGLACVASDVGDCDRSARLHGAAQALNDPTAEPWQDPESRYRADSLAIVRARLGEEQFERVYALGAALSFDEAVALGFGRTVRS